MVMSLNESFKTSDTALSAYLVSEGFGAPEIEFLNNSRAFFVFSKGNPKIEKAIHSWDSATATGNVVMFFQAYQTLLRRIRERY